MAVRIYIRQNSNGEVRDFLDDRWSADDFEQNGEFLWSEGNYACDCNRRLFFRRVNGEPDDTSAECTDTEYAVRITSEDGTRELYAEDDWHLTIN